MNSIERSEALRTIVEPRFHLRMGEVYGTAQASNDTAQLELRCLTIPQAEYILRYLRTEHLALKNEHTAKGGTK